MCSREIAVIAKIESVDSLKNLEGIIRASDGAMVARGDMGAQIPLEEVPSAQLKIVKLCRHLNKPVIVASQLLESMIEYPTPTRAEVADVSEAVRQRADALMLSGGGERRNAMRQWSFQILHLLSLTKFQRKSVIQLLKWLTTWEWMHSLSLQGQVTWPHCFHAAALIVRSLHLHPQHL
ncbi:unnamed protein product [Musa textilis]